jgi:hypothetical protein
MGWITAMGNVTKMWWNKTRDIVIKAITIVERVERKFDEHVLKEDKRDIALVDLIKECHEQCPEKDAFDQYQKDANGTLKRMEKKYDKFFIEHADVKKTVHDMKTAKKTVKALVGETFRIITIIAIIAGGILTWLRYVESKKPIGKVDTEKYIEQYLENNTDNS